MYVEEVREFDENQLRFDVLFVWRELDCFSFEERIVLVWMEVLMFIYFFIIIEEMYNSVESMFGKEGLIEFMFIIL